MMYVTEPAKQIPVIADVDVAVIGGGCTGTIAAIRAARMGARVALIERGNMFGGVAVHGLVNVWHTLYDTDFKEQIIHGLTEEIESYLLKDGAARVENTDSAGIRFNPMRLSVTLDRLVLREKIQVYFHTMYAGLLTDGDAITAVLVDNKDGRGAICAGMFIDATGDGDLCRDTGLTPYRNSPLQPPSSCSFLQLVPGKNFDLAELIPAHGAEFGLDDDWGWGGVVPGLDSLSFRADNHVFGVDCSKAAELTKAELIGRQKTAAVSDLLKKYADPGFEIAGLPSVIGIRDTVHYETLYKVTEDDLLLARKFDNTIARGTYRLDVHHHNDNGITFRYLDGRTETMYGKGERTVHSDWIREKQETGIISKDFVPGKYYSVPWEMLVQNKIRNLIPVGRMLNAEPSAFGALRVMVNLNQMGEAAGVGAVAALDSGKRIYDLDGREVVKHLGK